ncbi:NAD(P)/FAD-dependent oxidoreductase [Halomicroarcula sp. GCM10025817]|uniref:NAD(P)/FAD-dependent oxidoreductase n=1 Tax=Haloarcula TaxID=2237 RepID=UPI0023E7D52E|nr:FAD-dependent oxidoreductase [Halomicroarcula sp. SYNS111]
MRIAVVGGGAVGLVAAAALADRDADVVCFERDELGNGATGRAAGICYDAFADPLDAAVADRALARYREWDLLEPWPYVWVARDEADARAVRAQVDRMQRLGRNVSHADGATLADRYPALETETITAAGVAHDAGLLDPTEVVDALAVRAREAGAVLRPGTPVSLVADDLRTLATPAGEERFDAVVVAAGWATERLLADADVDLALKTYRAQVLETTPVDATLPSLYDATREFYWRPRGDGLLVGDGAHDASPGEWNRDADPSFLESALGRLGATTTLDPAVARSWAGLCTATPDRDPLVGRVADGLWVATGWQGHGLMRAPAMGEYLASSVLGTEHPIDAQVADRLDPTRFDGTETFDALGDPTRDWE